MKNSSKAGAFIIISLFALIPVARSQVAGNNIVLINNIKFYRNKIKYNFSEQLSQDEILYNNFNLNYKYIGNTLVIAGVIVTMGAGLVAIYDVGYPAGSQPPKLPINQQYIDVGAFLGGMELILLGAHFEDISKRRKANQKPKISIIGTGNQLGIACNFK